MRRFLLALAVLVLLAGCGNSLADTRAPDRAYIHELERQDVWTVTIDGYTTDDLLVSVGTSGGGYPHDGVVLQQWHPAGDIDPALAIRSIADKLVASSWTERQDSRTKSAADLRTFDDVIATTEWGTFNSVAYLSPDPPMSFGGAGSTIRGKGVLTWEDSGCETC